MATLGDETEVGTVATSRGVAKTVGVGEMRVAVPAAAVCAAMAGACGPSVGTGVAVWPRTATHDERSVGIRRMRARYARRRATEVISSLLTK